MIRKGCTYTRKCFTGADANFSKRLHEHVLQNII